MFQQLKILLFLSLLLLSYQQQQCIYGQNCPYDRGVCMEDFYCKCNEGFYSFIDKTLPPDQPQTYCNYEQISHYQPLILEFVLLGHFSVGHYWIGAFKVFLFLLYASLTYYLKADFELPKLFTYLFEKLVDKENLVRGSSSFISEKQLDMIRQLVGIIWTLMYFEDILLYLFKVYNDGNGVPLI